VGHAEGPRGQTVPQRARYNDHRREPNDQHPDHLGIGDAIGAALGACGAYDGDDRFASFARVRDCGAAHRVTLADGHDAWLIVGYEEARAALNDAQLSKDMRAALATGTGVVAARVVTRTGTGHEPLLRVRDHDHEPALAPVCYQHLAPGQRAQASGSA
jgi:hypothetical protein